MYRAQVVKKETVEKRRIEILEATCDVVIERGFAGTRVADVAKKLGVSNSLIHYQPKINFGLKKNSVITEV